MTQETEKQPTPAAPAKAKAPQKAGKGKRRGKRYRGLAMKIDRTKTYSPAEAVKLVKETSGAKFDTTVDLHLRMGQHLELDRLGPLDRRRVRAQVVGELQQEGVDGLAHGVFGIAVYRPGERQHLRVELVGDQPVDEPR